MSENLIRLQALLAKVETTYKTDATPSATTDAVQIEELFWNNLRWGYREENLRPDIAQAGLGSAGLSTPVGRWAEIEVAVALKGCATEIAAANLPEWDALIRACTMQGTVSGVSPNTQVEYKPRSTGHESVTLYAYGAGLLYKIVGARGTYRISVIPGQFGRIIFTLSGVLTDVSEAALPSATYAQKAVGPPGVKNEGLTLNSYDPPGYSEFEFSLNANVVELPHGNDPDGHGGYAITQIDPQFTVQIERPVLSSFNPWSLRDAGTLFAWDLGPVGSAQYNKWTLAGSKGRIIDATQADQDGIALIGLTVRAQNTDEQTADSSFTLTIT